MVIQHVLRQMFSIVLLSIPFISNAEILHGIFPLQSLQNIKANYPYGRFTRVNAAWVTEAEAFYSMTGEGFPGTLYLAFEDGRPRQKKVVAEKCVGDSPSMSAGVCEIFQKLANSPDDTALTINWVRWVPPQPIPYERYRSKYGEPTMVSFNDNTMKPNAFWEKVNLRADLADDNKSVLSVTTNFSRSELRAAWLRIGEFVPDDLKDFEKQLVTPKEKSKIRPKAM